MSEEVKDVTVEEVKESSIDLKKFDKATEQPKELNEVEALKAALAAEKKRADEAELARERDKLARDKAMRERAELSRAVKEKEKALEEPNAELEQLRAELAERALKDKKTELLLASTERMGISQDMAKTIVNSVYHPDTGEVDVGSLVDNFATIINDARKTERDATYEQAYTEFASGKPRSIGGNTKDLSVEELALEKYKKKRGIK